MSIARSAESTGTARVWLLALTTLAAAALAIVFWPDGEASPAPPAAVRLSLSLTDELSLGTDPDHPFGLALAPDGRRLAFPASRTGERALWLRDLTSGAIEALPGTTGAVLPFWAPDGSAIGFFADGHMRAFTLADGRVHDLADAPVPLGGAWHADGTIAFTPNERSGVWRRTPAGRLGMLTTLADGEDSHRFPAWREDGTALMFFVASADRTRQGVWLMPSEAPTQRTRLTGSDAHGLPVGESLVFSSGGALVAQAIDRERRRLTGRPVLLDARVGHGPEHQLFAAAARDVVVWGAPASALRRLQWVDRTGTPLGLVGEPMDAWDLRVAPRRERVAVARVDPQLGTLDIWTYEGRRPIPRRISPAIDSDASPVWSPDGRRLAWVSAGRSVIVRDAGATQDERVLHTFDAPVSVTDWSPDARALVLTRARAGNGYDIVLLDVANPTATDRAVRATVRTYADSAFDETAGAVSPDGRWLAYASNESGRFEVYLDRFPTPGRRARLTVGGGTAPRWRADGREIYFRRGSSIHAVRPDIHASTPEALSSEELFDAGGDLRAFDVSRDGQRFLLNVPEAGRSAEPLTVLVNVQSLLPVPTVDNGRPNP